MTEKDKLCQLAFCGNCVSFLLNMNYIKKISQIIQILMIRTNMLIVNPCKYKYVNRIINYSSNK